MKKAIHINEAMQILDLAREHKQTVNLKVWEGQTGNVLEYRGWLVTSSSWKKGWHKIVNPVSNQIRTVPDVFIFEVMEGAIKCKVEVIADAFLGDPGIHAVEEGTDDVAERLRYETKHLACVMAFLEEMRGLDLVLTATGFGVVSTQDTAPASKMRVDALDGDLRRNEYFSRSRLLRELFLIEGWSNTTQRHDNVISLFWAFPFLEQYAGISHPKPEDWNVNVPAMLAADNHLRKHLGHAYMEELLQQLTSNSLTDANRPVMILCQKYIGAWIAQNHNLKQELYMRLINRLEADLSLYPTYADSEGYRLNHFTPYENHAEDSAFHFVG